MGVEKVPLCVDCLIGPRYWLSPLLSVLQRGPQWFFWKRKTLTPQIQRSKGQTKSAWILAKCSLNFQGKIIYGMEMVWDVLCKTCLGSKILTKCGLVIHFCPFGKRQRNIMDLNKPWYSTGFSLEAHHRLSASQTSTSWMYVFRSVGLRLCPLSVFLESVKDWDLRNLDVDTKSIALWC